MPALADGVVEGLRVGRNALIPDEDRSRLVADTALEILPTDNMVEEELQ